MAAGRHLLLCFRAALLSGGNGESADADGAGAERLSADGSRFLRRRFRPVHFADLPDSGCGGTDG